MHLRLSPPIAPVAFVAALLAASGGCGAPEPTKASPPAPTATTAPGTPAVGLEAIPEIREARARRHQGYLEMEGAYAARDPRDKTIHFNQALQALDAAQVSYHRALPLAPERYRPVIDREIDAVAERMRQILRDRPPPEAR